MAYGFQQLDGGGNVLVDSSKGTSLMHTVILDFESTLYPNTSYLNSSTYPYYVDIYVLGCTSLSSFNNEYVRIRNHGNGTADWGWPTNAKDQTFSFISYSGTSSTTAEASRNLGRIRLTFAGITTGITNSAAALLKVEKQTWNVYSIGKTLSQ